MQLKAALLLSLLSFFGFGQNYRVFNFTTDTLSFRDTTGLVRFITFDSASTSANATTYYPSEELGYEWFMDSCTHHLYDTAWAGYSIVERNDSVYFHHSRFNLFFDVSNKSTVPVLAGSALPYSFYINYLRTDYRQVHNGQSDSVKVFQLTVKDSLNQTRQSSSPILIEISKTNGIQSLPLLTGIGNGMQWNPNQQRVKYKLLTRREIFDFEIGDEFQYRINSRSWTSQPTTYSISEVINKMAVNPDSVVYTMARTYDGYDLSVPMTVKYLIFKDTITLSYGRLSEPIRNALTDSPGLEKLSWYKDAEWNRDGLWVQQGYFGVMDSCLAMPFEPKTSDFYYAPGLGETRFEYLITDVVQSSFQRELIYFKKTSGGTGGTRYNIDLEELKSNPIAIYPNPATTHLNFELADSREPQVEIYDLSGKLHLKASFSGKNQTLNIEKLPAGVYFIKSRSGSAKFVKL